MSSPRISFSSILGDLRRPQIATEYNADQAVQTLPTLGNKVLIIGQKTSSGIANDSTSQQIFSSADANLYAGNGSIVALTAKAALSANPDLDLSIVTLSDAGGSADATGSFAFDGDSTTAGNIDLWVGNMNFNVAVTALDSSSTIATNVQTAIAAKEHLLPVTSTVAAGTVTLVARNKGVLGNNIPLATKQNEMSTAGVTITTTQPTGGSGAVDISNALLGVFPGDFNIIICPNNDDTNLGLLKTHIDSVSGPTEGRPCIGVFGNTVNDTGTIQDQCGTTLNSERLTCGFLPYVKTTEHGHSLDYEVAGAYAAVIASESDPARPLQTLPLTGIAPSSIEYRMTKTQQESLLENGVTPLVPGVGEQVRIVRAITTYTTNAAGIDDIAYLDLTTIRTLDFVRKAIETREGLRFPRAKLSTRTPAQVRAQIIDVLLQLESLDIVERVQKNLPGIICERDSQDPNRLNCLIPTDVVNGLVILANRIDLYL